MENIAITIETNTDQTYPKQTISVDTTDMLGNIVDFEKKLERKINIIDKSPAIRHTIIDMSSVPSMKLDDK